MCVSVGSQKTASCAACLVFNFSEVSVRRQRRERLVLYPVSKNRVVAGSRVACSVSSPVLSQKPVSRSGFVVPILDKQRHAVSGLRHVSTDMLPVRRFVGLWDPRKQRHGRSVMCEV